MENLFSIISIISTVTVGVNRPIAIFIFFWKGVLIMENLTTALDTVSDLVAEVVTIVTGTPVLMVFLAASFLGIGIRMFRRLKG